MSTYAVVGVVQELYFVEAESEDEARNEVINRDPEWVQPSAWETIDIKVYDEKDWRAAGRFVMPRRSKWDSDHQHYWHRLAEYRPTTEGLYTYVCECGEWLIDINFDPNKTHSEHLNLTGHGSDGEGQF